LSSWSDVTTYPHRFGGKEFHFKAAEIGHTHTGGIVDIPFPCLVRDSLLAEGLAEEHHRVPNSGWANSHSLRRPARATVKRESDMRIYRLFVVFALWSVTTLAAQNTADLCSSTVQEPSVRSLRALNTAEMSFAARHQRFASVSELLSDGDAKKYLPMFGSATDPLSGYTLHSVITAMVSRTSPR
jgi:hypothetical protein